MTIATARLDLRLDAIAAEAVVMLSEQESRHFLAALDAPFQPNQRLRRAMQDAAATPLHEPC